MIVNVRIELSEDERNTMFRRLTGKTTKGKVSRADVTAWVKNELERFLTVGSPTTEAVVEVEDDFNVEDFTAQDIEDVMKQNVGLLRRVNLLQHKLDTMK